MNPNILPAYNEPDSSSYSNDSTRTEVFPASLNSRCSPPPPYFEFDSCVQPTPYEQHQILQFPHVQYLQQQRLQYPQQESLQYHEETSHYPQRHRMPFRRENNHPILYEPPTKNYNCSEVDIVCYCFCFLPICFLICILYFASINGF